MLGAARHNENARTTSPAAAPSRRLASPSLRHAALVGAIAVAVLCAATLAPGGDACAYSVDGKFGVGYEETLVALGGVESGALPDIRAAGLGVWGWIGDVGFEGIFGFRALLVSNQAADFAGFVALGAHYNVFRAPTVNLSAGVRVDIGFGRGVDATTGNAKASSVGFAVEVPLRAVYFFSEQFSISGTVGPLLALNGNAPHPLTGATKSTEFSLFRGGFSGGVGFTVWLR